MWKTLNKSYIKIQAEKLFSWKDHVNWVIRWILRYENLGTNGQCLKIQNNLYKWILLSDHQSFSV